MCPWVRNQEAKFWNFNFIFKFINKLCSTISDGKTFVKFLFVVCIFELSIYNWLMFLLGRAYSFLMGSAL